MSELAISDITHENGALQFTISGSHEKGLDKGVINAIRRTLLSDIPTVAFDTDPTDGGDIKMVTNDTSLHNEMMLHRIGLLPLHINPDNFQKRYLFECKVRHDKSSPFQMVTANDIDIYPLKTHLMKRVDDLNDESIMDRDPNERENLMAILETNHPDNYDLRHRLSQSDKDKIFRPYIFRKIKNYCLLNELKSTQSQGSYQSLHFYGSPSVGTARQNSRYQAVSQASYEFLQDEDLFQRALKEKLDTSDISPEDIDDYKKRFRVAESERYFHRDKEGEPYRYRFQIKSSHYWDAGELMKRSLQILMDRCETLQKAFLSLLQESETPISFTKNKDNLTYKYTLFNYDHTMGNLIQSYISRYSINDSDESLLHLCGYKMPHPLKSEIVLFATLNKKHKICEANEEQQDQAVTAFLMEQMIAIRENLKKISNVIEKKL